MTEWNQTDIRMLRFILISFSGFQDGPSHAALISIFSVIYATTLVENILFILVILSDSRLHSPMYILICNLAILDICIPTATIPQMLHGLTSDDHSITSGGCIAQMSFYVIFGITEYLILALMAFDRYQAICKPLHYPTVMTNKFVLILALLCWTPGTCINFMHVYFVLNAQFCGQNKVQYYFCDYSAVLALACGDIFLPDTVNFVMVMTIMPVILTCIVTSYAKIILVIKAASSESRRKAFSTCASHLFVLFVFVLVALFVFISYRIPGFSDDARILTAVIQNIFPSFANPIIYCLKTKELREAFLKILKKHKIIEAEY
ncbi:olfactory receptor 6Y1-like [Protopterus annectens]|uniref:olfactory receptor 6Y1-like n=1 Tax=Protopterus annectens TaxID=7888 RepID=UPI001CF963A8|nr:olfactory receptor 6Y1-like [Protopterus annectens]